MQPDNRVKLVERQLAAYNRRNLEEFIGCYHPDIIVVRLISTTDVCRGKAEFIEKYQPSSTPVLNFIAS